jgi:predicted murein hydrolase (TIGR00659 family)
VTIDDLDAPIAALFWAATTLVAYAASKRVYRRWRNPLLSPMLIVPALLILVATALHATYAEYLSGTRWLMLMLGPATVAFSVPIWRERRLIRRYWKVLAFGIAVGSSVSVTSAWILARSLHFDKDLQQTLMPRSVTTPFAMEISARIGGVPELTAVLVIVTGLIGAAIGEALLIWLPRDSALARGTAYGMAAHGVGVARAYELGAREGAVAGLVMVLAGLLNVLLMPLCFGWL